MTTPARMSGMPALTHAARNVEATSPRSAVPRLPCPTARLAHVLPATADSPPRAPAGQRDVVPHGPAPLGRELALRKYTPRIPKDAR